MKAARRPRAMWVSPEGREERLRAVMGMGLREWRLTAEISARRTRRHAERFIALNASLFCVCFWR